MTGINEGWVYLNDAQATWAYAICGFVFALFMIPESHSGQVRPEDRRYVGRSVAGRRLYHCRLDEELHRSGDRVRHPWRHGHGIGYAAPTPAAVKWFGPISVVSSWASWSAGTVEPPSTLLPGQMADHPIRHLGELHRSRYPLCGCRRHRRAAAGMARARVRASSASVTGQDRSGGSRVDQPDRCRLGRRRHGEDRSVLRPGLHVHWNLPIRSVDHRQRSPMLSKTAATIAFFAANAWLLRPTAVW